MAATNRIGAVDIALQSRFPIHAKFVPPTEDELIKAFKFRLACTQLTDEQWKDIIRSTKGISFRQISSFVEKAQQLVFNEVCDSGKDYDTITKDDLILTFKHLK
eukprot:374320_1